MAIQSGKYLRNNIFYIFEVSCRAPKTPQNRKKTLKPAKMGGFRGPKDPPKLKKMLLFELFVKLYCYSAFQNRFTFCFTIIEKHFMIFSKKNIDFLGKFKHFTPFYIVKKLETHQFLRAMRRVSFTATN